MELLYMLEKIRLPGLNEFMLLITRLGEETAFLVAALVVFWCVDKRRGYFIMSVGFLGTMISQAMKLLCRIPRPWVLDENFTILEAAREAADGYSFPSGHSQSAVGTFGAIACTTHHKWVRGLCIAAAILVPFSRMYVGVHTPWDVLVGALLSVILLLLVRPVIYGKGDLGMKWLMGGMLVMAALLLLFVKRFPFPEDVDVYNLQSGTKNAYTMLGCLLGMEVVYEAERKHVKFTTQAVWWAQILKVVLGLALVLLVKEGLRKPLELILSAGTARAARYCLVVITAGLLWPMTFRWFSGLGEKK